MDAWRSKKSHFSFTFFAKYWKNLFKVLDKSLVFYKCKFNVILSSKKILSLFLSKDKFENNIWEKLKEFVPEKFLH